MHDRKRRATSNYKFMEAALIVSQDYVDKYGEKDFATVLLVIANMVCMICGDSLPHIKNKCLRVFSHKSLRLRVYYISTAKHLDVNRGPFCMSMRDRWLVKEHATSDSDRAA